MLGVGRIFDLPAVLIRADDGRDGPLRETTRALAFFSLLSRYLLTHWPERKIILPASQICSYLTQSHCACGTVLIEVKEGQDCLQGND